MNAGEDPADTAPVTLGLCVAVADDGQVYVPVEAVVALLRAMATAGRACGDEMDGDLIAAALDLHADGLELRAIEAVSAEVPP